MRSDDELLRHVREQAGVRRRRRQRALVAGTAAVVVLLAGVGALAATGGDDRGEGVTADGAGSTTTSEAPTTTETPTTRESTTTSTTSTTTTTAPPPVETTTTEPPTTTTETPTTTEPPIAPVSRTAAGEGITLTVTATQDRARPGEVELTIRVEAAHGSGPSGSVDWQEEVYAPEHYGPWAEYLPTSCDDMIDDDPATNPGPDTHAGPVDVTYTMTHRYEGAPRRVTIAVGGFVSFCTTDSTSTDLELTVDVAG